ncbi:MAG: hypothetical protein R2706_19080 [Acidimicrobiales bacterium]
MGDHFDPELLASGDRRNVTDNYRYWTLEAIVADATPETTLVPCGHRTPATTSTSAPWCAPPMHSSPEVHIIGKKRWNRRGDGHRSLPAHRHHPTVDAAAGGPTDAGLVVVGIDNLPGSLRLKPTRWD